MTTPLLELKDLQVAYGGIQAVKGIDLNVDQGELVCLIGAGGAWVFNLAFGLGAYLGFLEQVQLREEEIDGDGGHLDGVLNVAKQGEAIRAEVTRTTGLALRWVLNAFALWVVSVVVPGIHALA